MNNKSGIYKITSPSGKIYIGETINFKKDLIDIKEWDVNRNLNYIIL